MRSEARKIGILGILIGTLIFSGFSPDQDQPVRFLAPTLDDSVSYDQGKLLILSVSKEAVPNLLVSTCWKMDRYMDVSPKTLKESFPKDFYKLFSTKTTIEKLVYSIRFYGGFSRPETLAFAYKDTVTIRTLWSMPALTAFAQSVQAPEALGVSLSVTGWRDSLYMPVYDDPVTDGRALYKIHVQLNPGLNKIYVGATGNRAAMVEYRTSFDQDNKTIVDRPSRFHNSPLEESCTTCHEGLPSASKGASMTADCAVCHKAFDSAVFLHAPVEMKECGSCHEWSAKTKTISPKVEAPELCYDCHKEKKAAVDSSVVPHPVGDQCLMCHSPHGTNIRHQLKTDVFSLCTKCHPEESLNHPVGRHPLRFAKDPLNGEEMSCVSCHNPHGSPYESLLKVEGGKMVVCLQCHDK